MKTLIFKTGESVDFIECYSAGEYVQGAQRDVLDFRFDPAVVSLDEVDALFTADACDRLVIRETVTGQVQAVSEDGTPAADEDGNPVMETVERTEEFVHDGYGVRVALCKKKFTLATGNGAEDVEQISVKMGQYTYTESQLNSLTDTVDVLVMESLMA